jgi:glycosyltransferase involved in cell wall biosynthesis
MVISQLEIFGSARGLTGYDTLVRGVIFALHAKGVRIKLHDFKEWSSTAVLKSPLLDILEQQQISPDWRLSFCLLDQVPLYPSLNACFTMFEATKISQSWVERSRHLDVTIVPTQFCKNVFEECGVWNVKVVPLGVDLNLFNEDTEPLGMISEKQSPSDFSTRFLYVCERSARKNVETLLRAWYKGTKPSDDKCLILKTSSFSEARLRGLVPLVKDLKKRYSGAPVFIYSKLLSPEDTAKLFALCTHYISTSRGEGWDLCAHQAAAMGKNLIVPAHTAYLEYLQGYAKFVSVKKVPTNQTGVTRSLYMGAEWFEPNEEEVAEAIKQASSSDKPDEKALARVRKLTWDNTASKVLAVLEDKPEIYNKEATEGNVAMICKTAGERCGIGDYTMSLIRSLVPDVLVTGDDKAYLSSFKAANQKFKTVHLQLEYQFHTPSRLKRLFTTLGQTSKIVVTMHTVNVGAQAHNEILKEYADLIIVLTLKQKEILISLGFDEQKIAVIPLGCEALKHSRDKTFDFGFFGFAYFHKGLHKLLSAMHKKEMQQYKMLALSCQPHQESSGYFEFCKSFLSPEVSPRVTWITEHLPREQAWSLLNQCKLIVLPYDEFGGFASSASARFCLTSGRPLLVSDTCFFSDLIGGDAPVRVYKEELIKALPEALEWGTAITDEDVWKYCDNHGWDRVAALHKQAYNRI